MLRDYLSVVRDALSAQKEIYQVKEQRLRLAQEEYRQLNDAWRDKSTSQTSRGSQNQTEQRCRCSGPALTLPLCCFAPTVNSRSSSSSKYDPDILKAEIATAKSRVGPLVRGPWDSLTDQFQNDHRSQTVTVTSGNACFCVGESVEAGPGLYEAGAAVQRTRIRDPQRVSLTQTPWTLKLSSLLSSPLLSLSTFEGLFSVFGVGSTSFHAPVVHPGEGILISDIPMADNSWMLIGSGGFVGL